MSGCFLVFLFFSTSSNPFTLKLLNTMDFQLSVRGSDCRIIEECLISCLFTEWPAGTNPPPKYFSQNSNLISHSWGSKLAQCIVFSLVFNILLMRLERLSMVFKYLERLLPPPPEFSPDPPEPHPDPPDSREVFSRSLSPPFPHLTFVLQLVLLLIFSGPHNLRHLHWSTRAASCVGILA